MVGLYQKRDPSYNQKCFLHKKRVQEDGSALYYSLEANSYFMCKDLGFTTMLTSQDGHTQKSVAGKLETLDLKDGEIEPDDYVEYAGQLYIVGNVTFEDIEREKNISTRASGKTTIEVRR